MGQQNNKEQEKMAFRRVHVCIGCQESEGRPGPLGVVRDTSPGGQGLPWPGWGVRKEHLRGIFQCELKSHHTHSTQRLTVFKALSLVGTPDSGATRGRNAQSDSKLCIFFSMLPTEQPCQVGGVKPLLSSEETDSGK